MIIGAPPQPWSQLSHAKRKFANNKNDFNGPKRLKPSAAKTTIKPRNVNVKIEKVLPIQKTSAKKGTRSSSVLSVNDTDDGASARADMPEPPPRQTRSSTRSGVVPSRSNHSNKPDVDDDDVDDGDDDGDGEDDGDYGDDGDDGDDDGDDDDDDKPLVSNKCEEHAKGSDSTPDPSPRQTRTSTARRGRAKVIPSRSNNGNKPDESDDDDDDDNKPLVSNKRKGREGSLHTQRKRVRILAPSSEEEDDDGKGPGVSNSDARHQPPSKESVAKVSDGKGKSVESERKTKEGRGEKRIAAPVNSKFYHQVFVPFNQQTANLQMGLYRLNQSQSPQ